MPSHTVQQGECLSSLAAAFGLASWKDLYNLPGNAALKTKRLNPNVLAPGDVVMVPDSTGPKKAVGCATAQDHLFIVQTPRVRLRLLLQDADDEPYVDKRFEVAIGQKKLTGRTNAKGLIDVAVPAKAQKGHLKVWFDEEENPDDPGPDIDGDLEIGHLDPVDSVTGLQARLQNLGFRCEVNGDLDKETLAAAHAFRAKTGLEAVEDDAAIDESLRASLLQAHDGE
jgi:N-acetylmuramoyl-L-alanine amidase